MTERVRFSRTLFDRSRPWPRRSSGTSAMPSRPISAWRGLRTVTGLPQSSTEPRERADAEERLEEFALAVALQAADAEHLALVQVEARHPCRRWPTERSRTRSAMRSVAVGLPLGIEPVEPPAEHLGDDLVVADRAGLVRGDGHAVAEHGDAVGDVAHLGAGGARCR